MMAEDHDEFTRFVPDYHGSEEHDASPDDDLVTKSTKRVVDDVRGLRHGVIYSTDGAVADVETWLDRYCEGRWSLEIEDMDQGLSRKTLKLRFELESDKTKLLAAIAAR